MCARACVHVRTHMCCARACGGGDRLLLYTLLVDHVYLCRTTLARWRAAQVTEQGGAVKEKERRPFLASECTDLPKAEKWRMQIIREIARKVAQIQNGKR